MWLCASCGPIIGALNPHNNGSTLADKIEKTKSLFLFESIWISSLIQDERLVPPEVVSPQT